MKRIIGSLFAILAIAMFVMACGDDTLKCGDDEIKAINKDGVEKCYKTCETTNNCPSPTTQECRPASKDTTTKICHDKKVTEPNNDPNNDPNNNPNNDPKEPTAEDLKLCDGYCQLVYGCITSECSQINPDAVQDAVKSCIFGNAQSGGCAADLVGPQADQARKEYQEFVYDETGKERTCEYTESIRCGVFEFGDICGCKAPKGLGNACEKDSDTCDGGSLDVGACLHNDAFPDGSCVALPCSPSYEKDGNNVEGKSGQANTDSNACGDKAACMFLQGQNNRVSGQCMATCDKKDDCRPNYSCRPFGEDGATGKMVKICIADSCKEDAECNKDGAKGRCGETSKVCEFTCEDAKTKTFCETGGGECEAGADDKTFCVLP